VKADIDRHLESLDPVHGDDAIDSARAELDEAGNHLGRLDHRLCMFCDDLDGELPTSISDAIDAAELILKHLRAAEKCLDRKRARR